MIHSKELLALQYLIFIMYIYKSHHLYVNMKQFGITVTNRKYRIKEVIERPPTEFYL